MILDNCPACIVSILEKDTWKVNSPDGWCNCFSSCSRKISCSINGVCSLGGFYEIRSFWDRCFLQSNFRPKTNSYGVVLMNWWYVAFIDQPISGNAFAQSLWPDSGSQACKLSLAKLSSSSRNLWLSGVCGRPLLALMSWLSTNLKKHFLNSPPLSACDISGSPRNITNMEMHLAISSESSPAVANSELYFV